MNPTPVATIRLVPEDTIIRIIEPDWIGMLMWMACLVVIILVGYRKGLALIALWLRWRMAAIETALAGRLAILVARAECARAVRRAMLPVRRHSIASLLRSAGAFLVAVLDDVAADWRRW